MWKADRPFIISWLGKACPDSPGNAPPPLFLLFFFLVSIFYFVFYFCFCFVFCFDFVSGIPVLYFFEYLSILLRYFNKDDLRCSALGERLIRYQKIF